MRRNLLPPFVFLAFLTILGFLGMIRPGFSGAVAPDSCNNDCCSVTNVQLEKYDVTVRRISLSTDNGISFPIVREIGETINIAQQNVPVTFASDLEVPVGTVTHAMVTLGGTVNIKGSVDYQGDTYSTQSDGSANPTAAAADLSAKIQDGDITSTSAVNFKIAESVSPLPQDRVHLQMQFFTDGAICLRDNGQGSFFFTPNPITVKVVEVQR